MALPIRDTWLVPFHLKARSRKARRIWQTADAQQKQCRFAHSVAFAPKVSLRHGFPAKRKMLGPYPLKALTLCETLQAFLTRVFSSTRLKELGFPPLEVTGIGLEESRLMVFEEGGLRLGWSTFVSVSMRFQREATSSSS